MAPPVMFSHSRKPVCRIFFAQRIDRDSLELHDVRAGRPACDKPFRAGIDHIDRAAALQVKKLADHLYPLRCKN